MIKCPNCENTEKVLLIWNWRFLYHDFVCGNCRLQLSVKIDPKSSVNEQLYNMLEQLFLFEAEAELLEKIEHMSDEEKRARLKELCDRKKKNGQD